MPREMGVSQNSGPPLNQQETWGNNPEALEGVSWRTLGRQFPPPENGARGVATSLSLQPLAVRLVAGVCYIVTCAAHVRC